MLIPQYYFYKLFREGTEDTILWVIFEPKSKILNTLISLSLWSFELFCSSSLYNLFDMIFCFILYCFQLWQQLIFYCIQLLKWSITINTITIKRIFSNKCQFKHLSFEHFLFKYTKFDYRFNYMQSMQSLLTQVSFDKNFNLIL